MDFFRNRRPNHLRLLLLTFTTCLLITACGGSSDDDDDDSGGSADIAININETFNLDAGESVLVVAENRSHTNGSGISKIITANAASPQPNNGYVASTIDIVDATTSTTSDTIDFSANGLASGATAMQLAAFFEMQNNYVDASAATAIRLTLSSAAITFADQFSFNGSIVTGNTHSEVMADINRLPNIDASIDSNGVIAVIASDGNDLRVNLGNAAAGQTIGIESFVISNGTVVVLDSATIGDGQPHTKATIGGAVAVTLDYPLQLSNAGSGNIFGATISVEYSERNGFNPLDPDTYNHATAIGITDSLGNEHTMVQYFVKQSALAGTYPNRWAMYVMIDGKNVGAPDTSGTPLPAAFDLTFDMNGQLDAAITDNIEIGSWTPLDDNGNPNGAATARITINIAGSTQFAGSFAVTNVDVN